MSKTEKTTNNNILQKNLLNSYLTVSWVIIPLLVIQLLAYNFTSYNLPFYQLILIIIGTTGLIIFNLFKRNKWFCNNFYFIQASYLILLIGFEFIWYSSLPSERQLISLILGITITGIALIKPKVTILFYLAVVIILMFVNYVNYFPVFKHINYFILSSICIISFNFWRVKFTNQLNLSKISYKNIFEGDEALIFVIDVKLHNIIEHNNTALNYFNDSIIKGKSFIELFTTSYDRNNVQSYLKKVINTKGKLVFESDFNPKDKTYLPKEFEFRTAQFFDKQVIIIHVLLIEERQKKIKKLLDEKNHLYLKEEENHQATQKLLHTNTKFIENIFESSLDMIIATDINNIITSVNKAALMKFGYSKKEILGQHLDLLIAKGYNNDSIKNINYSHKYTGEVENVTKEGNVFKSYLSASSIKNDEGKLIGYMGISRDLSEIGEKEKIITTQTSLLESLFQSESDVFIWILNSKLELTSFNKGIDSYFNKINTSIHLKKGFCFFNQIDVAIIPQHFNKTVDIYKSVLKGKKVHFEGVLVDSNNNKYWSDIHLAPVVLPNGDIKEIVCLATDITDQKNKIQIIKENESNIRAVIKAIPDMLFKLHKDGYVIDFEINHPHQEILLKTFIKNYKKLKGSKLTEIFTLDKKFGKEVTNLIFKTINTEVLQTQNFEYTYKTKTFYFENRYSKINDNEVIVVVRDRTFEVENEQQLLNTLDEREVLLKEVHHRVKNNLQIINSILNLQSSYITDDKTLEIISESQNRIRAMSFIHESLYQTKNFSSINFKDYIENLLTNLTYSYQVGTKITLKKDIEDIDLVLDQAIPCGLILNELITNSLKYAYKADEKGEIYIAIKKKGNTVEMLVQDYGVGLPKNFDVSSTDSLGLSLVDSLTDQIDGQLILKTDGGTKILIIFEL